MLTIDVGAAGDFNTVGEALLAVPYHTQATLRIAEGVYKEKIFCEKADITLIGAGAGKTVVEWADGAYHPHPDGRKFGTFRSYTAFFGGGRVRVENLAIVNAAGDGRVAGQGIAAYVDAEAAAFRGVRLIGRQDTLFCAPLPETERQPGGFLGPRVFAPRMMSRQHYEDCYIEGDVDFIFGGADAVFDRCEIVSLDRGEAVNGYAAAPSGGAGGLGFVFRDCRFAGAGCADGTVYLGRPWRPSGKAALLRCHIDAHINPEGWAAWPGAEGGEAVFIEYQCHGAGAGTSARVPWRTRLDDDAAAALAASAEETIRAARGDVERRYQ